MMTHNIYILIPLLILAFLFSTAYMALQLSGDAGISRLLERQPKHHKLLLVWQKKWNRLIDAYRITLAITSYVIFVLVYDLSNEFDLIQKMVLYVVALATYIFLIWMLARAIAENYADRITLAVTPLAVLLSWVLFPFTVSLNWLENQIHHEFTKRSDIDDRPSTEDEVINLIDENNNQELDAEEREIIRSVFEFGDTVVREVMTPRVDIIGLSSTASIEVCIQLAGEKPHSRFPVYYESIDDVVGMVHIRDLLRSTTDQYALEISTLVKKVAFVPETMPLNDVLQLMKKKRSQLVMVVDEYGGTSGLVTMEDVIEELVGEIEDEYDLDEKDLIKRSDGTVLVQAKMPIYELNERLSATFLESDEYDSIGGLICSELGCIPAIGDSLELSGYEIKIQNASQRQVKIIQLRPLHAADES
jgi:putative hemolysin